MTGRPRDDEGFTLVEMLASMTVLALFATGILGTVLALVRTQRDNTERVRAGEIASQYIELARAKSALSLTLGQTTPTPQPSGFTVTQDAAIVPANAAISTCSSPGGKLTYIRVTESVTWPSMGKVKPVRSDTLVALPITGLDANKGTLAVPVQDAAGSPVSGVTVTLSNGSSVVTGTDGCAVFLGLAPGSYTASAGKPGYVNPLGALSDTNSATTVIKATTAVSGPLRYAPGGAISVTYSTVAGSVVPDSLPLTLGSSSDTAYPPRPFYACGDPAATSGSCASAGQAPRLVGSVLNSDATRNGIFPTSTSFSYQVWAGNCTTHPASPTAVSLVPGATASATVPLGAVQVRLATAGVAKAGNVQAVQTVSSSCATTTIALGPVAATAAGTTFALPPGTWNIQAVLPTVQALPTLDVVVTAGSTAQATVQVL